MTAVRNVPLAAAGPRVRDVMLAAPDTLPPATTVAEARPALASPRLRLVLVADGEAFIGAVTPDRLAGQTDLGVTLGELATAPVSTVSPDDEVSRALALLEAAGTDRLPVVSDDGRLVGLVCFNRRRGHFCVDDPSG